MAAETAWIARVRSASLALGEPIEYTGLTHVEGYLVPDMLSIEGDLVRLRPALVPGSGIFITDETGATRFSGILTRIERRGDGSGSLIYAGDLVRFRWRLCQPVPAGPWATWAQTAAYHVVTGSAETRLLALITANAGYTAYSGGGVERRIANLRVPASLNRGPVGTTSARFDVLLDLVASLAESAGLRVQIVQTYTGLTPYLDVLVTEAPDLSSWARYGTPAGGGPGMLGEDWSYALELPVASSILAAAGGEGKERILYSLNADHADEGSLWGFRIEQFMDARGSGGSQNEAKTALAEAKVIEMAASKERWDTGKRRELALIAYDSAIAALADHPGAANYTAVRDAAAAAFTEAATAYTDAGTALTAATADRVAAQAAVTAAVAADLVEITASMDEAMLSAAGNKEISAPIVNTPELRLGTDIPVGALVSAVIDGVILTERVRQTTTTITGASGSPTVDIAAIFGNPEGLVSPAQRKLAAALRRISAIERNV